MRKLIEKKKYQELFPITIVTQIINMAADMHVADLKVQSDLLDPSFDGYKLSLEPLPTYKSDLVNGKSFINKLVTCIDIIFSLLTVFFSLLKKKERTFKN